MHSYALISLHIVYFSSHGLPGDQTETSEELVNKVIAKLNMKLFAGDASKLYCHDVDIYHRMRSRSISGNTA